MAVKTLSSKTFVNGRSYVMLPTPKDYTEGIHTWREMHRGIIINITHHSISEYNPEGTWCYYLILDQRMFQNPSDFALFDLPPEIRTFYGSYHESYDYFDTPDLEWHCGITYYSKTKELDRRTGEYFTVPKLGCDYAHLSDLEYHYSASYLTVLFDAQNSVNTLHSLFPLNFNHYGTIDHIDNFHLTETGNVIHFPVN